MSWLYESARDLPKCILPFYLFIQSVSNFSFVLSCHLITFEVKLANVTAQNSVLINASVLTSTQLF